MGSEARGPGGGLCSYCGGSDPACGGARSREGCTPHKAQVLSGSGGCYRGWSVCGRLGESWGWCVYCGGADCWCGGWSGRGGYSGAVRWDGCWCAAVCCDGVCHGGSVSCVCGYSHLGQRADFRVCFHEDSCAGCCVCARLGLSVCCGCAGWGCRCAMSVRTNRESCSSWESHTVRTVGLLEEGDVRDSVLWRRAVLSVVRESRRGRMSWRGRGGKTGVEEGWAWEGTGEMRHLVRGRRRILQGIRLDIAPQRKVWRGGQCKGKGTHRGPGGSWKVVQDWEWPGERGYYCLHCNSPTPPGTAQTPLDLQHSRLQMKRQPCPCLWPLKASLSGMEINFLCLL